MTHPDEALLRRFEPVVRCTKGDRFFPTDVEPYVRACSLWVQRPGEEPVKVARAGELTLETLPQQPLDGKPIAIPGHSISLTVTGALVGNLSSTGAGPAAVKLVSVPRAKL